MFTIQPSKSDSPRTNPNILPCRIHHDGPIDSLQRHWTPTNDQGTPTSHFRGRKLRGRRVAIPEGYRGIVATPTDRALPETANGDGATGEAGSEEEVKVLEQRSTFDEFVVWGHETAPAADDPFVKGVEEWLKLAEAMNSAGTKKEGSC